MAIAGETRTNRRERIRTAMVGGFLALFIFSVIGLLNLAIWAESSPNAQNTIFREWLRNDISEAVYLQFDCTGDFQCSADNRYAERLAPGGSQLIVVAPGRAFHDRVVNASGQPIGCLAINFGVPNGILPPSSLPVKLVSQLSPCPRQSNPAS